MSAELGPAIDPRTERALLDLLGFFDEMSEYVVPLGERNFHEHRPTQLVAEALLHRMGEAVARIQRDDPEFIASHLEVAWGKIEGMRNVVAHEYGFIDYRIVWRALSESLPQDIASIRDILGP